MLAMDLEGSEICDWLAAQGITCALLKYRVPASGPNWDPECNCRDIPKVPMACRMHSVQWACCAHRPSAGQSIRSGSG